MMNSYQFKYKGILYECCGEDKDLQIRNFNHCIKTRDWSTLSNRIKNQLKWAPKDLVEVNGVMTEKMTEKDVEIVKKVINKNKFW